MGGKFFWVLVTWGIVLVSSQALASGANDCNSIRLASRCARKIECKWTEGVCDGPPTRATTTPTPTLITTHINTTTPTTPSSYKPSITPPNIKPAPPTSLASKKGVEEKNDEWGPEKIGKLIGGFVGGFGLLGSLLGLCCTKRGRQYLIVFIAMMSSLEPHIRKLDDQIPILPTTATPIAP